MKTYSDSAVTKDDLVHLSDCHSTEFAKFKMTMLALVVSQVISYALIVYLIIQ